MGVVDTWKFEIAMATTSLSSLFICRRFCTLYRPLYPINNILNRPTNQWTTIGRVETISHQQEKRNFSTSQIEQRSLSERILRSIGWLGGFYSRKEVMKRGALSLYQKCIDDIDCASFMKVVSLPDTFQSWFLISHLHIWLCLVRLKREGKDGSFFMYQLVSFFWKDVEERMKAMGVTSGRIIGTSLRELNSEFRGLVIAYEEGLLTNDRTLASAFWRNWISDKDTTDPQVLSVLVDYVRSQVKIMDSSDREELLTKGKININPLVLKM